MKAPKITLKHLNYVVTLDKVQHFGQAADECHISQPTFSEGIQTIENLLGVKMFNREKNTFQNTTKEGRIIIDKASKVLIAVHEIEETAEKLRVKCN